MNRFGGVVLALVLLAPAWATAQSRPASTMHTNSASLYLDRAKRSNREDEKKDLLEKLKDRLREPPPDGGLWTSPKVAAWMAGELGLAAVLPQRGWEALKAIGWTVQKPRPRHPASATPEEREAFKKSWSRPSLRREPSTRTRRLRSGPRTSTASG